MKRLTFTACYRSLVSAIAAPELSSSFTATVVAVGALAYAFGKLPQAARNMRNGKALVQRFRTACQVTLAEAQALQHAVQESRKAIEALDPNDENRLAALQRCRRAMIVFPDAVERMQRSARIAADALEGLRPLEPVLTMVERDWRAKQRHALEAIAEFNRDMPVTAARKQVNELLAQLDTLYAQAVELDTTRALLMADHLGATVRPDPDALIATLNRMADFCDARGIALPKPDAS